MGAAYQEPPSGLIKMNMEPSINDEIRPHSFHLDAFNKQSSKSRRELLSQGAKDALSFALHDTERIEERTGRNRSDQVLCTLQGTNSFSSFTIQGQRRCDEVQCLARILQYRLRSWRDLLLRPSLPWCHLLLRAG